MAGSQDYVQMIDSMKSAFNDFMTVSNEFFQRLTYAGELASKSYSVGKSCINDVDSITADPGKGFMKKGVESGKRFLDTASGIGGLLEAYLPKICAPMSMPQSSPSYVPPKADPLKTCSAAAQKPSKEELVDKIKQFSESMTPYGKFRMEFEFIDYEIKSKIKHGIDDKISADKGYSAHVAAAKKIDFAKRSSEPLEKKLEDTAYVGRASPEADKKYLLKCANFVGDLYNNGRNYNEIKNFAASQGIAVKSYDEMLGLVAANIANGGSYGRYNYNSRIAEHLGLNEFVVNAKLSGMTYAQIKEAVKKTAKGMNISRSTVRRMMKKHAEKKAAAKK